MPLGASQVAWLLAVAMQPAAMDLWSCRREAAVMNEFAIGAAGSAVISHRSHGPTDFTASSAHREAVDACLAHGTAAASRVAAAIDHRLREPTDSVIDSTRRGAEGACLAHATAFAPTGLAIVELWPMDSEWPCPAEEDGAAKPEVPYLLRLRFASLAQESGFMDAYQPILSQGLLPLA